MSNNYLIDTDIIIYWLNDTYSQINKKIEKIEDDCIFISAITVAELYYGAYNSLRIRNNLNLINELISEINILNFNKKSGKQFGEIKAYLKSKGKIVNDSDIFIAASAISNNMILVTNNEKHFRKIKNLNIQNWTK